MSSNYPNAYPPYHGYPPLPAAATAPASAQGSAADPYAAYYAQMMADPAYAAYAAQYYAAYGASTTVAAASDPHLAMYGASATAAASASSSATAPPVSLDLDQVILKSEITRKPASAMKSKTAAASSSAPSAAAAAAASSSTAQGGTDSAQAAAATTNGDAPAVDASAPRKKKRKADSEKSKADKDKDQGQGQEEDQPQAKKKRMIRYAAGQVWEDKSLIEWPDNDYRLFVGDLGPEVMTQTLEQAFGKYASFQKAHVVRDQRTGKSKGYGFVSFMNGEDFVKAFQEYNNKYLGSRPVKLRKSTWQERNIEKKKEKLAKIFK